MLQMRDTRFVLSKHWPVVSGAQIPEEGMALSYMKEDGETKVQPSSDTAGEIFAGVSFSRNSAPAMLPNVETGVVPAGQSITLARTPLAGQLMVKVNGVQKTIATPVDANTKVGSAAGVLTFHADAVGSSYFVQYIYAPTVLEGRAIKGDAPVGGLSSVTLGVVGVLQNADFSTNFFDASADWSTAIYAKLGDGGIFVPADAATGLKNVVVKNSPTAANPFLTLSINVA